MDDYEPSNFTPLPDKKRTAKYLRPYTDFVPKDDKRKYLYLLFMLHMNNLPDDVVEDLTSTLREHLNIKPFLTDHLPYLGD